jgi:hypothetical protein
MGELVGFGEQMARTNGRHHPSVTLTLAVQHQVWRSRRGRSGAPTQPQSLAPKAEWRSAVRRSLIHNRTLRGECAIVNVNATHRLAANGGP